MQLPATLQSKIIDFLKTLPTLDDTKSRRAFIYSAGLDIQLKDLIHFDEPPAQFVPLLVATLLDYGELNDGRYSLNAVLETATRYVGREGQEDCERLIQEVEKFIHSKQQPTSKLKRTPLSSLTVIITIVCVTIFVSYFVLTQLITMSTKTESFDNKIFGILIGIFSGEDKQGKSLQHTFINTLNARFQELGLQDAEAQSFSTSHITSFSQARQIGKEYNAELVIWGNITLAGIIPNITLIRTSSALSTVMQPEVSLLKESLTHNALAVINDIRFPALTDEPTFLASFVTGLRYYQEENYQKALRYFLNSLPDNTTYNKQYMTRSPILFFLGNTYYCLGHYEKALDMYQKIDEMPIGSVALWNNMGIVLRIQGHYNEAINFYTKALEREPQNAILYYNKGNAYYHQGNYKEAIINYSKALEINPEYSQAYHNRAKSYDRLESIQEAESKGLGINNYYISNLDLTGFENLSGLSGIEWNHNSFFNPNYDSAQFSDVYDQDLIYDISTNDTFPDSKVILGNVPFYLVAIGIVVITGLVRIMITIWFKKI